MTTMEMAKEAFASRRAVDAWFKDSAPNFEAFAEMVRKEEREACAKTCDEWRTGCDSRTMQQEGWAAECANAIRERSNNELSRPKGRLE